MGYCQVADMNIVANASAVGCRIVGTKNVHLQRALPVAVSHATLMRWVAPGVDCPVRPRGSAPATLKYRSAVKGKAVSGGCVAKHPLRHQFRPTIW